MNVLAIPQRSEPRVNKQTEIRIFGINSHGKPVNVSASTIDVSKHGARLSGAVGWDVPGETVGIRCGEAKSRFQIMWIGPAGTPVEGQMGMRCLDGKNIWGVEHVGQEGPQLVAGRKGPQPVRRYIDSRRLHQRYVLTGSANVREFSKNIPHWTQLNDICIGGCYVKTMVPYGAHTPVAITIHALEMKIEMLGTVVVKDPLVGMGIKFTDMSPVDRQRLEQAINHLVQLGDRTLGRRR